MKRIFLSLIAIFYMHVFYAQNKFVGFWEGNFPKENNSLFMQFILSEKDGIMQLIINTPEQGMFDFTGGKVSVKEDSLYISVPVFGAKYEAKLENNMLYGTFVQGGQNITLNLTNKAENEAYKVKRPQTPTEPFSYYVEDLIFTNKKAKIKLSGTLTLPDTNNRYPIAVLVSGSGAQDRNEEIYKHKIFMVIADYCAKNGIGVFRYDDRGVGKSEGKFADATTADFSSDATAAIAFIKKYKFADSKKIGIIGHSEGAMIAMMQGKNKDVCFAVSMAGVGIPCDQLMVIQQDLIYAGMGVDEDTREAFWNYFTKVSNIIQTEVDVNEMKTQISETFNETLMQLPKKTRDKMGFNEKYLMASIASYLSPWFKYFIGIKPLRYIPEIKCNFLAINGSKDVQVPAEENIEAIKTYIKPDPKKHTDFKIFEGLNHLFQPCKTGNPNEYGMIETTIDESVLKYMSDWIKDVCKDVTKK